MQKTQLVIFYMIYWLFSNVERYVKLLVLKFPEFIKLVDRYFNF